MDSGIPSSMMARTMGIISLDCLGAPMSMRFPAPNFSISLSAAKKVNAPAKKPNAGNPVFEASFTASKINS